MPGDATRHPGINVFSRVLYQLSYLAADRPSATAQDRAAHDGTGSVARRALARLGAFARERPYFPAASQASR